jgi:AcrR family transcriptional regulator
VAGSDTRKAASEETRRKLIEAAAEEFATHGVRGARIQAITDRAGVAIGSFYTHFKDKDALFDAIAEMGKELFLAGVEETKREAGDRAPRDMTAMRNAIAFGEAYGSLFRIFLSRGGPDNSDMRELVDTLARDRAKDLKRGQAEGWVRPGLNPEFTARAEMGAIFHLVDWWLANPDAATREEITAALIELRRFGVEGFEPQE